MRYLTLFLAITIFILCATASAFEDAPAITDREIIESLTELKAGQSNLNSRFDDMGKSIDRRFDEMNKSIDRRFDEMNKSIDRLNSMVLWGFGVIFTGIFALIGFVIWDRRTTLAPAARKYDALERALIDYSDKHPDLKESLHHVGLL